MLRCLFHPIELFNYNFFFLAFLNVELIFQTKMCILNWIEYEEIRTPGKFHTTDSNTQYSYVLLFLRRINVFLNFNTQTQSENEAINKNPLFIWIWIKWSNDQMWHWHCFFFKWSIVLKATLAIKWTHLLNLKQICTTICAFHSHTHNPSLYIRAKCYYRFAYNSKKSRTKFPALREIHAFEG